MMVYQKIISDDSNSLNNEAGRLVHRQAYANVRKLSLDSVTAPKCWTPDDQYDNERP